MIKVGIIGAENSHSLAFSTALNIPDAEGNYRYPEIRVVKCYGEGDSAKVLAEKANIPQVVNSPDDFDDCDTIMITTRRGSLHYKQILKYVERGMNVFIDKPFTVSVEEAKLLAAAAQKSGSLVSGGSACKYAPDVVEMAKTVAELRKNGQLKTASLNFNVFMDIEYDGFFFYASHLIEIATKLFGCDIVKLSAHKLGNTVIANIAYDDIQVSLHFTEGVFDQSCTLYAKNGIVYKRFDISTISAEELKVFVEMLRSKKAPFPVTDMIYPVVVADAIYRSYNNDGQTIVLR